MAAMFPIVEKYRARARRLRFVPLTDEELRQRARRDAAAVVDQAIEELEATDEEAAMFAMFLEERLPDAIRGRLISDWIAETLPVSRPSAAE